MRVFYCVTTVVTECDDVCSAITGVRLSEFKPESTVDCSAKKDVFQVWFDNYFDALEFVKEQCRKE